MPPRGCYVVAIRGSGTRDECRTGVCHAQNLMIAERVAAILKVDAERIPCQLKAVPGADSGDTWLVWDEQIRGYQSFNWLNSDKSPMKAMALRAKQFSERLANESESTCATPESFAVAPTACSPENVIQAVAGVVNAFANLGAVNQLCEAKRKIREQYPRLANTVINGGGLPPGKNFFDALKDLRLDAPRLTSTCEYVDLVESTLTGIVGATNQLAKLIERGGMDSLNAVGGEWATQTVLARLMKIEATAQELLRVVQTERMNEGRIEFDTDSKERQLAADREWITELQVQFEAARRLPPKTALLSVDQDAINRLADTVVARAVEAMESRDEAAIGGTDTDWKDVQGRLLAKRSRGEPYTSLRKLKVELGCSDATIRKAIADSDELKGWKARSKATKAAPKATDLGAAVKENTRQTTEPAPDDFLPDDDVDATMRWLIEQAKPDERAKLNVLDDAGRRALVAEFQAQNLDAEPSPLEPDNPSKRPWKVKEFKRA
jgi:hypothetical protein